MTLSRPSIDIGIAYSQIVQGPMLIHRTSIIADLDDPIEHFRDSRSELFVVLFWNRSRSWDSLYERLAGERIDLVKGYNRYHKPVTHLGWGNRSSYPND